jgi:hypothetical protein
MVLYELLTLAPPVTATTREAVFQHIISKVLPPISWRNPAVPTDLENVVHQATAKDPEERYATADCFAKDLQRILEEKRPLASKYRYESDDKSVQATRPGKVLFSAVCISLWIPSFCTFGFVSIFFRAIAKFTWEPGEIWYVLAFFSASVFGIIWTLFNVRGTLKGSILALRSTELFAAVMTLIGVYAFITLREAESWRQFIVIVYVLGGAVPALLMPFVVVCLESRESWQWFCDVRESRRARRRHHVEQRL